MQSYQYLLNTLYIVSALTSEGYKGRDGKQQSHPVVNLHSFRREISSAFCFILFLDLPSSFGSPFLKDPLFHIAYTYTLLK